VWDVVGWGVIKEEEVRLGVWVLGGVERVVY
jgi:hypothetical protein